LVILVGLVYLGIIAVEVPHLINSQLWKELAVFSFFLLLALIYSIGLVLNIKIPNIVDLLVIIFSPLAQFIQNL